MAESRRSTRQRILDATWDLLVERGDGDVSLDEVARRAGVSRQTIYAHFGSRRDLLVALVEGYKERVSYDELIAPVFAAPSAVDALRELVRFYVAFTPSIMGPSLALEAERARDPEVEKAFGARPTGRHQLTLHVATRLAAERSLAEGWTVATVAELLAACMSSSFAREIARRADWSIEDLAVALERMFTRAFVGPDQQGEAP